MYKRMNDDVEQKIASYRAQKEREARYKRFKETLTSFFSSENKDKEQFHQPDDVVEKNSNINHNLYEVDSLSEDDETFDSSWTYTDWIYYMLWFSLWAIVYLFFIQIQFGTVYLVVSGLVGMCCNTRTGPKKEDEVSAYSVFNKDCKSIDGTLKAEQFEREIRYGPSMVR